MKTTFWISGSFWNTTQVFSLPQFNAWLIFGGCRGQNPQKQDVTETAGTLLSALIYSLQNSLPKTLHRIFFCQTIKKCSSYFNLCVKQEAHFKKIRFIGPAKPQYVAKYSTAVSSTVLGTFWLGSNQDERKDRLIPVCKERSMDFLLKVIISLSFEKRHWCVMSNK